MKLIKVLKLTNFQEKGSFYKILNNLSDSQKKKEILTADLNFNSETEIEDAETLTITAGNATKSILINAPTYLLSAFSSASSVGTSVNEASDITFLMKTTGVPSGFSLNYTMYGTVSASDLTPEQNAWGISWIQVKAQKLNIF